MSDAPSCPVCGGEMERQENQNGVFWMCAEMDGCEGVISEEQYNEMR